MTAIRPEHTQPTPLTHVVAGLGVSGDPGDGSVTGITLDSRDVTPGALYVGLPGARAHGATFAPQAVAAGAVAVLTDDAGAALAAGAGVPVLVATDVRVAMAEAAARVFGRPAERLTTFGVTGTNGKTTTVALLEAALLAAGRRVGTVGTIGFRLDGAPLPSGRSTVTTPDSPDLQALLAVMAERGADAVALEVSSHAMVLERVTGFRFDVVAFLNLGRDHLDFHPDIEHYFEAKASLFTPEHARAAIVWVDDPRGVEVAERAVNAGLDVVRVGTGEGADYQLLDYRASAPLGGVATVLRRGESVAVQIALPGEYNMVDAVVALAMLEHAGVPTDAALAGLARAQVPGRMESLDLGDGAPAVVVDFAHTPQAVAAALSALGESFDHVVAVLGCGGDRDPDKRPLMGAAAARCADVVVITDDNPRSEDPAAIRAATLAGARDEVTRTGDSATLREVPGRAEAIEQALREAHPASVVAILGKGHEQGQQLADRVLEFDDAVEARRAWARITEGARP